MWRILHHLTAAALLVFCFLSPVSAQVYQDDFNDNVLNNSLWEYVTAGFGPTASETNQRLEINIPANSGNFLVFYAAYKSRFVLQGDFDVRVDYHLLEWPTRNGIRLGLVLEGELATNHRVSHTNANPAESYTTTIDNPSGDDFFHRIQTTDLSGTLRLTRVGGVFTGYYWDATALQWVAIYSRGNYTQNVPVYLMAWSSDPNFSQQAVRVAFDNFNAVPYNTISGRITLQATVNQAQPITFEFRPTNGDPAFQEIVTLNANRTYSLAGIPPGNYNVWIKGARWLAKVVSVDATQGSVTGVNATLLAGDANNDNSVDVLDLDLLIQAFDSESSSPNWNEGADFNADDFVDVLDLDLLLRNFDIAGDA